MAYQVGAQAGQNPVLYDQGAPVDSFSISPATLPAGLSFSTTTGAITGTPTAIATESSYTITGFNHYGSRFTLLKLRTTNAVATHLSFTVQPSNAVAGTAIAPTIQVSALDANGTVDSTFNYPITLSIGTNPGSGGLLGTSTVTASSGVATFSVSAVDKTGNGYTLTAAATGLTGATSLSFNINPGAANHLGFSTQPTNAVAGAAISPAVVVTAYDAYNNVDPTYSANIAVSIGTNPGGGTLSGTATLAASSGVATYSNLSINKAGSGYTLTASSGSLTGATSSAFIIAAGTATQLLFSVQPSSTVAATTITPSILVGAYDAYNNINTAYSGNITIAIGTNPGGGVLSGTLVLPAVSGVASFSNLSINKAGTGYTLSVSSGSLTGATSSTFNITAGTATQLKFSVQPTNTRAGVSISPAVQVGAYDANLNLVTSYLPNISIAIANNPGGGTLAGTTTIAPTGGLSSFSNLSIIKLGNGYTLTATSGTLTADTSTAFNITPGAATQLKFTVQPTNTVAGSSISPAVRVTAYDAYMNVDTTYTANVTASIGTNPGGGTLSGTATAAAASGIATFSNLSINKVGTGYTLTAASGTLTNDTSSAFTITPAAATQLKFSVQPSNTVAAVSISPAVQVTA